MDIKLNRNLIYLFKIKKADANGLFVWQQQVIKYVRLKPIIDDQEPNTKTVVLQARHRKFSKIIMLRNILLDLKN